MSTSTIHPNSKTVRGFALYVGLKNDSVAANDPQLKALLVQLRERLTELDPTAESYVAVALAPTSVEGRNLDIVRAALAEPSAKRAEAGKTNGIRKTGVVIDFTRQQVLLDGFDAKLTYREFKLLQFIVLREGLTVTREQLAEGVWGKDAIDSSSRATDVQIRRLRAKLGEYHKIVSTIRGEGYRFDRHADVKILHRQGPSPDRI